MFELETSAQFDRVSMERILFPRFFLLQELPLSSFGEHLVLTPDFYDQETIFLQRIKFFPHASTLC